MDLSFNLRVRRPRLRDRTSNELRARELPLLFARLAAEQSASVTALAQTVLDRHRLDAHPLERHHGTWTPFAQRVAIFTGTMPLIMRATCPSFAVAAAPFVNMKPAFTVALQPSFKPTAVGIGTSIEPRGPLGAGSRPRHD